MNKKIDIFVKIYKRLDVFLSFFFFYLSEKILGRNKYPSNTELRIFQKWNENKGILNYLEFHL